MRDPRLGIPPATPGGSGPATRPPAGGSGNLGRWGSLQGGLGVCLIVASTAIGAIITMATGSAPGFALGLFVVVGTVAAALAVRPRAGRMIFPVPVLSYLVAALISGYIYNRATGSSRTALTIGAAQWIASGFAAMAMATIAAIVLVTVRWYLWRRNRRARRHSGRPAPAPAPRPGRANLADPGYPAGHRAPDGAGTGGTGAWPDQGPPGPGRGRPGPHRGSGPYNFSSGA